MKLRILLMQARHTHDPARLEERHSFALRAGLDDEQFVLWDLLSGPPSMRDIRQYDALMIGGSGDYYVSKGNLPDFPAVLELLAEVVDAGHPTFASCFGFQLMVVALGGRIVYDPAQMEVGTYRLELTEAGRQDELFGYLPGEFSAQLGHKDRAAQLPPGTVHLASSSRSPIQAMRLPGKPIWATQFHPEMTGAENYERFFRYKDGYAATMSPEELKATLQRFKDSPETDELIPRFLKTVFA